MRNTCLNVVLKIMNTVYYKKKAIDTFTQKQQEWESVTHSEIMTLSKSILFEFGSATGTVITHTNIMM
jgi:hypothetical protein